MKNNTFPFIISTLSGLATLIGYLPIYINNKYQNKIIPLSLSTSAGIMLTISITSLIPEAYSYLNSTDKFVKILYLLININIGIIFLNILDRKTSVENSLYKLGIISSFVLILHNIPEGITTYLTTLMNKKLGINLSIAIALHNIPEGISIAVPIYYSTNSKKKAFLITLISGFSELLGAIIACIFIKRYLSHFIMFTILSITSGIMINLSIKELIPSSLEYNNKKLTIIGLIIGTIVMILCEFIL